MIDQPTISVAPPLIGDALVDFMESEPPGLFPENDESNFGFIIRRVWTDLIEDLIDQQTTLYNEKFVNTSEQYLDEWEIQQGVPHEPGGLDLATRRSIVLGRVRKGAFTHAMRNAIIERYITATFGTANKFSPSGMVLGAGIPLHSGLGSLLGTYNVVENIPGFSYTVYLLTGITVSPGMQRELTRVTPAGISFTIVSGATSYKAAVLARTPKLYWRLNEAPGATTAADTSGNGNTGAIGSGVILGQPVSVFATETSARFDNVNGYINANSYSPFVVGSQRTFMGWHNRSGLTDLDFLFLGNGSPGCYCYLDGTNSFTWRPQSGGANYTWNAAWPGLYQPVHWALTYNDTTGVAELFINGASLGTQTVTAGNKYIAGTTTFTLSAAGSNNGWNGYGQEISIFESILTLAQIQAIYNAKVL